MYNRYIPEDTSYTRVEEKSGPRRGERPSGFHLPDFLSGQDGLSALLGGPSSGGERGGLAGLLKALHLDQIDSGDVLLLLILLYLLVEGDDLELVIALGLVLLMGLGGDEETDTAS